MEEKIWNFIEKNKIYIFLIIITLLAFYTRYLMLDLMSGDYIFCLQPWSETLKENGGIQALKYDIGNYNVPYITILALLTYIPIDTLIGIKLVSTIFDFICALICAKITQIIIKDEKKKEFFGLLIYGIVIFLPTVLLNSACWGQCDSIYAAFILISIYYLMKENYLKSFIFLGISFAFKLQFIFILPLYVLIYISKRKFSCLYFGIIPIMNIIMCIPAMIMGKTIQSIINIYFNQAAENNSYLSLNFPSVYNIFFQQSSNYTFSPNEIFEKVGVLITVFVFVIIAFFILSKKIEFNKQSIIEFGLWSIMIATFLLPKMHDRYLFVGDILSIIYVLYNKDKFYIPIGISFISLYCYSYYLFGVTAIPLQCLSIFYGILLIIVSKDICQKYFFNENLSLTNTKKIV